MKKPCQMIFSAAAILFAVLSASPSVAAVEENWPGWRGDGSGISAEQNLPVEWNSEQNVLWGTALEGEGKSSPIVWGDRVFLTMATKTPQAVTSPRVAVGMGLGALVAALLAFVLGRERGANSYITDSGQPRQLLRWVHRFDRSITLATSVLAFVSICVIFLGAGYVEPGSDILAFRWSMTVTVFTIVAACGLLDIKSRWRLLGVAGMAVLAVNLVFFGPPRRYSTKELILLVLAAAFSAWWCFLLFQYKRARRSEAEPRPHTLWRVAAWRSIGVGALIAMATWQYLIVNYWQPRGEWLRAVSCLDRETGEVLWKKVVFGTNQSRLHAMNSYASPTPVTDGRYVVADFGPGIVCLDFDGRVLWKKMVPQYADRLMYGSAISPVMVGDVVLHTYFPEHMHPHKRRDQAEHARISALEKSTGRVVWETTPPNGTDSYDTPILGQMRNQDALFVATWGTLLACSPNDGTLLASWDIPVQQCVPSVVADDKMVYISSSKEHHSEGLVAVDTSAENDPEGQSHIAWRVRQGTTGVSSPALYDGHFYMVTEMGIATCLDAASGKVRWKKRLGGNYIASVVCGDDKVYFTATDGTTSVVQAGPEFELLAKNSIADEVEASLAVAGGRIFVRGKSQLYCFSSQNAYPEPAPALQIAKQPAAETASSESLKR